MVNIPPRFGDSKPCKLLTWGGVLYKLVDVLRALGECDGSTEKHLTQWKGKATFWILQSKGSCLESGIILTFNLELKEAVFNLGRKYFE